jgi:uncharacterized protein YifN (PemK superfamily)
MALSYQPPVGAVVMCDFSGNAVPEMVKIRPVVVIARNRHNNKLVSVVPLSTTPPSPLTAYHHALAENPMPGGQDIPCWAKCDMIATVALYRLDRIMAGRQRDGSRIYVVPKITDDALGAIRACVRFALHL